jgi:hypothetical protein
LVVKKSRDIESYQDKNPEENVFLMLLTIQKYSADDEKE